MINVGDKFMNPNSNYIQLDLAQEYNKMLDNAVTTIIDRKLGRTLTTLERELESQQKTEETENEDIQIDFYLNTQPTELGGVSTRIVIRCYRDQYLHTPIDITFLRGEQDKEIIKEKLIVILSKGGITLDVSKPYEMQSGVKTESIIGKAPFKVWKKVREDYLEAKNEQEKESQSTAGDEQDTNRIGPR